MNNGIIIPVYRHGKACVEVVNNLSSLHLPIILVDDGNDDETKQYLSQIVEAHPQVILVTLEKNSGKGSAFTAGVKKAHELALTHVLQIDADGQHDVNRVQFFFDRSAAAPEALICGYPEYDETVPAHRKNGRTFANNWTKIVTWEKGIRDALCGFRIYPVEATWHLLRHGNISRRMGFDIDVLTRLIWQGVPYEFYGVQVTYPADGISNFRVVKDNIGISFVFTRLCCGMLLRTPMLAARKLKKLFTHAKGTSHE